MELYRIRLYILLGGKAIGSSVGRIGRRGEVRLIKESNTTRARGLGYLIVYSIDPDSSHAT